MDDTCFNIFRTKEQLEQAAQHAADKASEPYKRSTYLYFMARYFVAYYEAQFSSLPIQVWNEYRNALDHFFRHQTSSDMAASTHINKMEGHIQRAILDICKIFCHDMKSYYNDLIEEEDDECLRIVDNGRFHTQLKQREREATDNFTIAKISDSELGTTAMTDNQILSRYLGASFSYIELVNTLSDRREDIDRLDAQIRSTRARAENSAEHRFFWGHVKAGLISKLIWAISAAALTAITLNWTEILNYLTRITLISE